MPWCTYSDPELANIGMNEQLARDAGIRFSSWVEEFTAMTGPWRKGKRQDV